MILNRAVDRRQVGRTSTIPAPVRGLNTRDALAAMDPRDALVAENVVCRAAWVEARKGTIGWAPGGPGVPPRSLLAYVGTDGTRQLFATYEGGTGLYRIPETAGSGTPIPSVLAFDLWQGTQVSNQAGNFLIIVPQFGGAPVYIYNGTTWSAATVTGPPANSLSQVAVWQRRVWFVQRNTTRAWYLPVDAIGGAATAFDFAGVFRRGGGLVAVIPWSVDGGDGLDDYVVFVSSVGEVAVYRGTDPASATTFGLVGVYFVGRPIGVRFYAQLGGDVLLLTEMGLVPLSSFLQSATVDKSKLLTARIESLIVEAVRTAPQTTRSVCELQVYLPGNLILLHIRATGGDYQLVMSLDSGAWSKWTLPGITTWLTTLGDLYYGQRESSAGFPTDRVGRAWVGGTDAQTLGGAVPINGRIVPAFSYFSAPTARKRYTFGRVTLESDSGGDIQRTLLLDYNQTLPALNLPVPAVGAQRVYSDWRTLQGFGYAATQAVQFRSSGDVWRMLAMDYTYEPGGLL